jgi:hypothetical protein
MDPTTYLINQVNSLFTIQFLVFGIVIGVVTQILRTLIEGICLRIEPYLPQWMDKYKEHIKLNWSNVILRGLPILVGVLISYFIVSYPYPAIFATSVWGRVFFGIVAGSAANIIYPFFRFYLKTYLPDNIKDQANGLLVQAGIKPKQLENKEVENPVPTTDDANKEPQEKS